MKVEKRQPVLVQEKETLPSKNIRAVLFATGYHPDLEPLMRYRPVPLLKVLDKPMIEHIIEFLVRQGIQKCDIVLSHFAHMIESLLEQGSRWGIHISYHLAKNPDYPLVPLSPTIGTWNEEHVLIGKTDVLPRFQLEDLKKTYGNGSEPTLLFYPSKMWTGWGMVSKTFLEKIPKNLAKAEIFDYFKPFHYHIEKGLPFLSIHSFLELQKTNIKLLNLKSDLQQFPVTARMLEPGIWISRGATIHPSAKIRGPVFIGENCQIKQYAQIGPNAVIENNCVIENKSVVEDALICQRSYVGEGLEIRHSIIDRNILINLELDTHVVIHDDFILAELKAPSFRQYLLRSLGRYFAAILLLIFSPFMLVLYFTRNVQRQQMLLLPSVEQKHRWKTFELLSFSKDKGRIEKKPFGFFACLPMLINILRGELHFTGVMPRSLEEVDLLPIDWKQLYLKSKAGLITLAMVEQGKSPSSDETYASEAFYMVHTGLWYDIKLCLRWLVKKFSCAFHTQS